MLLFTDVSFSDFLSVNIEYQNAYATKICFHRKSRHSNFPRINFQAFITCNNIWVQNKFSG